MSRQKKKLLSNLVPSAPSFYIRTKSRLKNRVTTVHLLQCKTNFFPFFQLLYLESAFLSIAYLTVANLARLGILVHYQVSVRSQYLVRLLSQCWITGVHTIHPLIKGLLSSTGIEPTLFQNSPSKVAGLQVHATTPSY